MLLKRVFCIFLSVVFLVTCHTENPRQRHTEAKANKPLKNERREKPIEIAFDRSADNTAKMMAGIVVTDYAAVCQSDSWRRCATAADSSWARAERQRFEPMRAWRDAELAAAHAATDVLYPFSGPDFIHAYTMFPHARNYRLFGLEPTGSLPDFRNQSPGKVAGYCESVQKALRDVFRRSYFLTKRMSADLPRINGVTTMICVFLVRTGNIVTHIQPMIITGSGQTMDWKGTDASVPEHTPKLVRIDFLDARTHGQKSVFYYSGDLSDAGLQARPAVARYLAQLPGNCAGYLKSASYLMHYASFSTVRNSMLQKCQTLLQDDTGIACKYLDKSTWDIRLYGVYVPPIAEFKNRLQPDLQQMYQDSAAIRALPFDLGYHWGRHKDNLLWAVRKTRG